MTSWQACSAEGRTRNAHTPAAQQGSHRVALSGAPRCPLPATPTGRRHAAAPDLEPGPTALPSNGRREGPCCRSWTAAVPLCPIGCATRRAGQSACRAPAARCRPARCQCAASAGGPSSERKGCRFEARRCPRDRRVSDRGTRERRGSIRSNPGHRPCRPCCKHTNCKDAVLAISHSSVKPKPLGSTSAGLGLLGIPISISWDDSFCEWKLGTETRRPQNSSSRDSKETPVLLSDVFLTNTHSYILQTQLGESGAC